jgi:hypothetical protein
MKKKILVLALTLASANVFAGTYFSPHISSNDTSVEVSVGNYSQDIKGFDIEDETGFKLSVNHKSHKNFGIEASYESADFKGGELNLARFGANMNIMDHYKEFDLKASLGAFTADIEGEKDTSFYVGLTFQGELIPHTLTGKIYARHYDLDREYYGKSQVGAQLDYHLDRNLNVFLASEMTGDYKSVSVGIAYKF